MFRKPLALALAAGLLLAAAVFGPAAAQDAPAVDAPAPFLPSAMRLTGLSPVYQQLNRCSAAALTIQLSYYQWDGNYDRVIAGLNTHPDDVAVRLDEMAAFARQQGLGAVARTGGSVELMKELIAGGFPVLIENSYYEGGRGYDDWMGHNRVLMGFDDTEGVFYTFDSLLGNGPDNTGRPIAYDDMAEKWRAFNRDFLVLYRPDEAARLQAILGEDWDEQANAERTLAISEAEIAAGTDDGFTEFNRGASLVALGRYEDAAAAFDAAFERGLPWRMLWYQYEPFEAYFQVGRYDDVIRLANETLSTTHGVEEMYYYLGLVYEQQGDLQRAAGNMEAAVWRNAHFTAAAEALARLRGEPTPTPAPGA